jgi:outer membrane protein OmpA-like peptidoglycan-associated protein
MVSRNAQTTVINGHKSGTSFGTGGGRTSEQSVQKEYKAAVALANKFGDKGFAGRFTKEGLEISIPLTHVEQFGFDIDSLGQEAQGRIREFGTIAQKNGAGRGISIVGHTDQIGTEEYNKDLGGRRATAAQLILMRLGLRNSITTSSRGESDLIVKGSDADTDSNIDRVAANRRVVITVAANIPGHLLGQSWDGKSSPNFSAGAAREGHGGNAALGVMDSANSKYFGLSSGDQGNGVSNIPPGVRHVATLQGRPLLEQKLENGNYQYSFINGNTGKKVVFWDSKKPLTGNQFKNGLVRESLDEKMGTKTANMPSEGRNLMNGREGSTDGVRHSAAGTVIEGGRVPGTTNKPDGEKIIGRHREMNIVEEFTNKRTWRYSMENPQTKESKVFFDSSRRLEIEEILGKTAMIAKVNKAVDEVAAPANNVRRFPPGERQISQIPDEIKKVRDYSGGDILVRFNQKGDWEYSWRKDNSELQKTFFVSKNLLDDARISRELKEFGLFRKKLNAVVEDLTRLQNRLSNSLSV